MDDVGRWQTRLRAPGISVHDSSLWTLRLEHEPPVPPVSKTESGGEGAAPKFGAVKDANCIKSKLGPKQTEKKVQKRFYFRS